MTESLTRVSPAHRRPPSSRLQEKGRTGEDIYPPVLPFSCNALCACLVGQGFSQNTSDFAAVTPDFARALDMRRDTRYGNRHDPARKVVARPEVE